MHRFAPWVLVTLATPPLNAQDPPGVQQMAQQAQELGKRLGGLQEDASENKQQIASACKEIDAFVEPMLDKPGYSLDHYVQVSSPLLEVYPAAALKVSEAGLKQFPDSRFLHDHVGFAHAKLADDQKPGAVWLTHMRAAEQAFRKSLTLKPETFHAHLGLCQVLDCLGQQEEALRELELSVKGAAEAQVPMPHLALRRGSLLLRANKPADALAALQSGTLDEAAREAAQVLILRAHALAGDAAKVEAQAKAMAAKGDPQRVALEHADALLWLGKKAEALKLLAKKPPKEGEDERGQALLAQSCAALEQFANASDFGAGSPLRAALTKALGHSFKAALPDKDGKLKETDLSPSPVMMAHLVQKAPAAPVKEWGNRVLMVLCLKAAPAWKAGPEEALVTKSIGVPPGPDELPGVLLGMRYAVGDPHEACGLASVRAVEKLQDKPATPKKK
jgi:hypothetical protein